MNTPPTPPNTPDISILEKEYVDGIFSMKNGGNIYDNTGKLVCCKMIDIEDGTVNPDTYGVSFEDLNFREIIQSIDDVQFCEDGTVVRVWKYKGEIKISTRKCIDAKKSWWSSRNFEQLFWECISNSEIQNFSESIDENFTYMFVIRHPENVIVVKHRKPSLVIIATIDNKTGESLSNFKSPGNVYKFQRPELNMIDEPIKNISNILRNPKFSKRGIIVKMTLKNFQVKYVKLDYPEFTNIKRIRRNVPYIGMRFIELNKEPEMQKQLYDFFPEHRDIFQTIYNDINKKVVQIQNTYYQVYIKKSLPIEETGLFERTLKQLHGEYKKTHEIVTRQKVYDKLYTLDAKILQYVLGWNL
jgi:hypothetical protein